MSTRSPGRQHTGRHRVAGHRPSHFGWTTSNDARVATIVLDRADKKNPLTFESYAELRDLFRDLAHASDVRAVVITGAGGNFSSGGDVFEIIKPLTQLPAPELLAFTRMTGDLIKAMRACPQPVVAAVDGIAAGAGAAIAMAADIRIATARSRTAFLFPRVGLAGCDMGACALLPRLVGLGRATELLLTGRTMDAAEAERMGFYTEIVSEAGLLRRAEDIAKSLADGPVFAHAMTKQMLQQEWNVSLDQAIEMEAQAQALCMGTKDFRRAFEAFAAKRPPVFEGD